MDAKEIGNAMLTPEQRANKAAGRCVWCGQPFTEKNVFTADGWRETQISHSCEACWDEMWKEV